VQASRPIRSDWTGLPPLPHVDVCLHAGGDRKSPALKQLRRTVTGHALVELAGKEKNGSGSLGEQPR